MLGKPTSYLGRRKRGLFGVKMTMIDLAKGIYFDYHYTYAQMYKNIRRIHKVGFRKEKEQDIGFVKKREVENRMW